IRLGQELFPLDHSCAVCGKIKCKRHRQTLLLETYQPWLDLKIPSKVDTSLSEVIDIFVKHVIIFKQTLNKHFYFRF
uniref:Uncharacterized protein n=1 Tax=Oreochromis niloticus TaxID=8128 RepID=A0A669DPX3_ORENI